VHIPEPLHIPTSVNVLPEQPAVPHTPLALLEQAPAPSHLPV
jgi:hypothetical protein